MSAVADLERIKLSGDPHTAGVKPGVLVGVPMSSVCPNVHVTGPLLWLICLVRVCA